MVTMSDAASQPAGVPATVPAVETEGVHEDPAHLPGLVGENREPRMRLDQAESVAKPRKEEGGFNQTRAIDGEKTAEDGLHVCFGTPHRGETALDQLSRSAPHEAANPREGQASQRTIALDQDVIRRGRYVADGVDEGAVEIEGDEADGTRARVQDQRPFLPSLQLM